MAVCFWIGKERRIYELCEIGLGVGDGRVDGVGKGKEKVSGGEVLKIVGGGVVKG